MAMYAQYGDPERVGLSEAAVREGLRLNHAAWKETRVKLLPRLGDRMARAWSTSSAVHG